MLPRGRLRELSLQSAATGGWVIMDCGVQGADYGVGSSSGAGGGGSVPGFSELLNCPREEITRSTSNVTVSNLSAFRPLKGVSVSTSTV